jgi:DNA primase
VKIPDEKIQEVRDAVNILDVVSQVVSLKPRGRSHVGLCPFHSEKTPSFTVDPARGFYHCFGCGAGGDVFSFVMRMEKVGFLDAVRSLAERVRIDLPSPERAGENAEIELLYRANRIAAEFFKSCLHETDAGKKALEYITRRGFGLETLDAFQIGYSPDAWDALIRKAGEAGVDPEALFRAGLAVPRKEGGGYYDRFRGRLMFPIHTVSGRVVGFGGRVLDSAENVPKYINTSETPIYQKSHILFGLYQSKSGIRRENRALLVEGYTDMMRLHQSGFDCAVASSGTALTEGQVRLLSQITRNVVLVFDGDSAGFRAAVRGVDLVLSGGLRVEVAVLPKGTDPDAFLRDQGSEAFSQILENRYPFVDFQLQQMRQDRDLSGTAEKTDAAKQLVATAAKIREPMERQLVIKDIAEKLGIEEELLLRELKKNTIREDAPASAQALPPAGRVDKAERGLLGLVLSGGNRIADRVFRSVSRDWFTGREAGILFETLLRDHGGQGIPRPEALFDRFREDESMTAYLTGLLAQPAVAEMEAEQYGMDCALRLAEEKLQERIDAVRRRIKEAGDGEGGGALREEWIEAKKMLENLKVAIVSDWKKNVDI